MLKQIKELFFLLDKKQKQRFFSLQILVILMALMEIIGIGSIGPFMAVVGDSSWIERSNILHHLYQLTGSQSQQNFILLLGLGVLILLVLASIVSMITTWCMSVYSYNVGTEIADSLYEFYLKQNWLFHVENSSANLTKNIATEAFRLTAGMILPLIQINAKIVVVFFISIAMVWYNATFATIGFVFFFFAYLGLFRLVKSRLSNNGRNVSEMSAKRFCMMNEGFNGIKEILLFDRSSYYIKRFQHSGRQFSHSAGDSYALAFAPRYLMEMLSFGVMIVLILYLVKTTNGDLGIILPVLAVYGVAGFKLLPALQNIYSCLSEIRSNMAAFNAIKNDLYKSRNTKSQKSSRLILGNYNVEKSIELERVTFSYPHKSNPVLNLLSIEIPANRTIGIVGESGAGKSTLMHILLGLLNVQQGTFKVDGREITAANTRQWQNSVAFVPQNVFLTDGSIGDNIAFGQEPEDVNHDLLTKAIEMSHLDNFIKQLPDGVNTKVGELGVKLSGGQKQRIAIARALYSQAGVLLFDEATSALDGASENLIMNAIDSFKGRKTIVLVAHRLTTVKNCDLIFFLQDGKVRSQGTFDYLMSHDESFRRIANMT